MAYDKSKSNSRNKQHRNDSKSGGNFNKHGKGGNGSSNGSSKPETRNPGFTTKGVQNAAAAMARYAGFGSMAVDIAAQQPSYWPMGVKVGLDSTLSKDDGFVINRDEKLQLAMSIEWAPVLGGTVIDENSAIYIAAKYLYMQIKASVTSSLQFEVADLAMYLVCVYEAYSLYASLWRIYGVINKYSMLNLTLPKALLRALGISDECAESIRTESALFYDNMIQLAGVMSQVFVPSDQVYSFYGKHEALNSTIWKDADSEVCQYYVFNQTGYYTWEPKTDDNGTMLKYHNNPFVTATNWRDLIQAVKSTIQKMTTDDDVATIGAALIKYFDGNRMMVTVYPQYYQVEERYDSSMLMLIENMTYTGLSDIDMSSFDIKQDVNTGFIRQVPVVKTADFPFFDTQPFFNFHGGFPTSEDFLAASQFKSLWMTEKTTETRPYKNTLISSGTELILKVAIIRYDYNDKRIGVVQMPNVMATNGTSYYDFFTALSNYDWHPIVPVITRGSGDNPITLKGWFGDLEYYRTLSVDALINLHNAANLYQFGFTIGK